jgi:hypothetical protein
MCVLGAPDKYYNISYYYGIIIRKTQYWYFTIEARVDISNKRTLCTTNIFYRKKKDTCSFIVFVVYFNYFLFEMYRTTVDDEYDDDDDNDNNPIRSLKMQLLAM